MSLTLQEQVERLLSEHGVTDVLDMICLLNGYTTKVMCGCATKGGKPCGIFVDEGHTCHHHQGQTSLLESSNNHRVISTKQKVIETPVEVEVTRCVGICVNGVQCIRNVKEGNLCTQHMKIQTKSETIVPSDGKCIGKFKDGRPCSYKAKNGQYCGHHIPK